MAEGGIPDAVEGVEVDLIVSAVTGAGLPAPGRRPWSAWSTRPGRPRPSTDGFVVHRPAPSGVSVVRDDDGALRVVGRAAERTVALSDVTTAEAQAYITDRLDRLGVPKALARAGAQEGDEVRIGGFTFTYIPD